MWPTSSLRTGIRILRIKRPSSVRGSRRFFEFWLEPQLELAKNYRLARTQLGEIEQIIEAHYDDFATILQRDVHSLANIEGLTLLPRLLSLLAARAGSLLNFSELSRTSGIPATTLKRYLTLFETTFLVRPLSAWSGNLGKRLVKAPKLFLSDSGLLSHLRGVTTDAPEESFGPVFENFVVMELRKQIGWSRRRPGMFFFRTQTGQEVDIVLEEASGRLVGIEVKASHTISSRDFQGLRVMAEATGKRFVRGIVLYAGADIVPFGANFHAVPLEALWQPTP